MNRTIPIVGSLFLSAISYFILLLNSLGIMEHVELLWGLPIGNVYIPLSIILAILGLGIGLLFVKGRNFYLNFIHSAVLTSALIPFLLSII